MMIKRLCWLGLMLGMLSQPLWAMGSLQFDSPQHAQSFQELIKEFRCVTCPNQSIADSQAPVACAMRDDIYRRVQAGETPESIRGYLLERYGDYVTYCPPIKPATWFLWGGPFILFALALLGFRSRVTVK